MAISVLKFKEEIEEVAAGASFFRDRQEVNDEIRYARWVGQSKDGRKWQSNLSKEPFPFDGASDIRVRECDIIVNSEVRTGMNAFRRSKLRVKGTEQSDWKDASHGTLLLDWMINTQMKPDITKEAKLVLDYRQHAGASILRIDWHQETAMELEEFTREELDAAAEQSETEEEAIEIANLVSLIDDGGLDEEAAEALVAFDERIDPSDAQKAVRDLREAGTAFIPMPYFRVNRPRWSARRLFRDVFMPLNTTTTQKARWIGDRYSFTEEEIKEKEVSEGWSKKFITEVLKHKGETSVSLFHTNEGEFGKHGDNGSFENSQDDDDEMYEIFYVYSKDSGKRNIPGVFFQPMSMFTGELAATKEPVLLDYKHGLYPFVEFMREETERGITSSRGIGEIMSTDQQAMKIQLDYGSDRTSLDIIPPVFLEPSRAIPGLVFGPGVQIPKRKNEVIEFVKMPNSMGNTEITMQHIQERINKYFGRDPNDPQSNLEYKQHLIDSILEEFEQALTHTFQLMQQFMPEVVTSIVTNSNEPPLSLSGEQIRGKFDLSLQFDARDMDAELLKEKIAVFKEAKSMDPDNRIDTSAMAVSVIEWLIPSAAQEIIRPVESIQQDEEKDEQDAISKAALGIEVPFNPEGKNAQFRLQVIQETIAKSQVLTKLSQDDETFVGIMKARADGYQQTLVQDQNAQIGRSGTQPFFEKQQQG